MIIAIYKPKGITSHDAIDQVRRATGEKKVGHAGTLDPLARGLLVIGIGKEFTKKLSEIVGKEKEYISTIKLGATSTTDDEEGDKEEVLCKEPAENEIKSAIDRFVGEILQIPPAFSALKIKGERAYKIARKGYTPEMKPRKVSVKSIELLEYKWPHLKLRVVTGPGVYIRSLARDIGEVLKTGGYLSDLERVRIGEFTKEKSLSISEVEKVLIQNKDAK